MVILYSVLTKDVSLPAELTGHAWGSCCSSFLHRNEAGRGWASVGQRCAPCASVRLLLFLHRHGGGHCPRTPLCGHACAAQPQPLGFGAVPAPSKGCSSGAAAPASGRAGSQVPCLVPPVVSGSSNLFQLFPQLRLGAQSHRPEAPVYLTADLKLPQLGARPCFSVR